MLFSVAFVLVQMATSIPPELYQTFVVEDEFGFNTQSLSSFVADQVKTAIISCTITAPSVAAFLAIVNRAGSRTGLYLCAGATGIPVLVITVYPIFILPWFYKLSPTRG